jgi:hypothetical protein
VSIARIPPSSSAENTSRAGLPPVSSSSNRSAKRAIIVFGKRE